MRVFQGILGFLVNKKYFKILKFRIFLYHLVDLSSLIKELFICTSTKVTK